MGTDYGDAAAAAMKRLDPKSPQYQAYAQLQDSFLTGNCEKQVADLAYVVQQAENPCWANAFSGAFIAQNNVFLKNNPCKSLDECAQLAACVAAGGGGSCPQQFYGMTELQQAYASASSCPM